MNDRDWIVPSAMLTALSGAFALAMMPDYSGVGPALNLLPMWLIVAGALAGLCGFHGLYRMQRAGVRDPVAHIGRLLVERWRTVLLVTAGITLAGLNMITFMWTKPLLNYLVPFWADPMLADVDYYLFLGNDPWTGLHWLNTIPMALFYHRGWFALMIVTLLLVLSRPPSREKSAVMLTYFLLWSIAGPAIHSLLPATGPIFFEQMGYGDRFAAIPVPDEIARMSTYLWTVYTGELFAPGSGISAMPSLHIATTAWMLIAVHVFARRWMVAAAPIGLLILLLSVSLGWHYVVDGIVGAAAALGCYWLCRRLLAREASSAQRPAMVGAGA